MTQTDVSQLPGTGIKPMRSLRRHYHVSLALWLFVVLAGLPVAWIKGQSYYAVESVFQVSPTYMKNLASDKEVEFQSNSQYREYVNHLSNTVTRYDVLARALHRLRAEGMDVQPKGLSERKFIEKLKKILTVRPIADTYMVRIGLEGQEKEALDDIVNAVTVSFLDTTRQEQLFGSVSRAEELSRHAARLHEEVVALEAQRVLLAELLGLTTFGENTINPYDAMLLQVREKTVHAGMERIQAEAVMQAFQAQRETPLVAGRSLLEMRLQDNGLQALRNEVVKRSEELRRNADGLTDKHPGRLPALAEYEEINGRLRALEGDFDQAAHNNIARRLAASLQQARRVEAEAQQALKVIEGQAADYARNFQKAMRITGEIRKRDQELKELRERLNFLDNERNAIGFVRLVTPALPAITPMGIGKIKLLLAFIGAATALALVVPVALDAVDRRIFTVNEAEKLIGIPAAGWQVDVVDLPTRLYAAEQSRRFASTLMRNKARGASGVFSFTSIKAGGGSTRIVLDTAAVLSQLGMRVLVVDANSFSRNDAFDHGRPGLSDHLGEAARLEEVLQTVRHEGAELDAVGFGMQGAGGVRRLDLLKAAIGHWLEDHDFILIDLPALLVSADAELLIEALGDVFMVLEAQSISKGEAARAKRLLQRLDPKGVGLFVNRIPVFQGSGYMEQLLVETIVKQKAERVMSQSRFRLMLELARLRWARKRAAWSKSRCGPSGPDRDGDHMTGR